MGSEMRQEPPEPPDGLSGVFPREARQRRSVAQDEAFRRRWRAWLAAELVLAAIVFMLVYSMAGCVIVQSVPDDRGRSAAAPVARIILEDARRSPSELPPK
jgi:hypothetical protein